MKPVISLAFSSRVFSIAFSIGISAQDGVTERLEHRAHTIGVVITIHPDADFVEGGDGNGSGSDFIRHGDNLGF
jgi:hypothetical protein